MAPVANLTVEGSSINRIESIMFRGRLFISYINSNNRLYFMKNLFSIDDDSKITVDSFTFVDNALSFDIMMDVSQPDITGLRMIYFVNTTKKFMMVKFTSMDAVSTYTVVSTNATFSSVACSDDFVGKLKCVAVRTSGEQCFVNLDLSKTATISEFNLSCSLARYSDFSANFWSVANDYVLMASEQASNNSRRVLVYRIHNSTKNPVFVSGSADLNDLDVPLDSSHISIGSNRVHTGVVLTAHNQRTLYFFKINEVKVNIAKDQKFSDISASNLIMYKLSTSPNSISLAQIFREKRKMSNRLLFAILGISLLFLIVWIVAKIFFKDELQREATDSKLDISDQLMIAMDDIKKDEADNEGDEDSVDRHNRACMEIDNSRL